MSEAFAVIKTGGKQYIVEAGKTIKIEKIGGKAKGDKIAFSDVLLVNEDASAKVGTPTVSGAIVEGEVTEVGRNKKVVIIKYKQKSRYYKKQGHRQPYLKVKISKIK